MIEVEKFNNEEDLVEFVNHDNVRVVSILILKEKLLLFYGVKGKEKE